MIQYIRERLRLRKLMMALEQKELSDALWGWIRSPS